VNCEGGAGEGRENRGGGGDAGEETACMNIRPFYDNRKDNIRRLESARLWAKSAYQFEDLKRAKMT